MLRMETGEEAPLRRRLYHRDYIRARINENEFSKTLFDFLARSIFDLKSHFRAFLKVQY